MPVAGGRTIGPAPTAVRPRSDTPGWRTVSAPTHTVRPRCGRVRAWSPRSASAIEMAIEQPAVNGGELAPVVDPLRLPRIGQAHQLDAAASASVRYSSPWALAGAGAASQEKTSGAGRA